MSNPDSSIGRLIIVDDEHAILDVFRAVFAGEPWSTVFCATGRAALEAFETHGVDVLLTDKNLPDVGGFELIEAARRVQPDAEAIVITGYASLDTALEAIALDVYDYLVKPPKDIFEVRRRVRQAFEHQALARQNGALVTQLTSRNEQLERALKALSEAQAELVRSETLAGVGTLAAGVAHEIASPLFGIMGLAEAIADEDELNSAREYGSEIVEYSRQIRDILAQLSDTPRPGQPVERLVVARVIDAARRLVERTPGFEAERVDVDAPDTAIVVASQGELTRVFVNLVKNALQATPPTGRVRVSATTKADDVVIAVEDDGPGVPEAQRTKIFEPFFTTKVTGQGTGLGLNIVYRLLQQWDATVHVESAASGGARFVMRFPRAPEP